MLKLVRSGHHAVVQASRTVARRIPRWTRESRLDWATGGIVLLLYAIVQLALLQGPRPFDPSLYFHRAADFPNIPPSLFTLRIGLIAPVHAAIRVFGPSEAALYAVPLGAGLLLAAAVYGTMLLLFRDRLLAAAAAIATALNAYYLLNSSSLFPDTLATATFTAGFFCLVAAGTRSQAQREARAPWLWVACAGVLFGWTYLIREFSLVLVPAVLAAILLLRYPARRVAALVAAALATFALDLLYGFWRYGDPLIHARRLLSRQGRPVEGRTGRRLEHIQDQLDTLLDTTLVFPRLLVSWNTGWAYLLLIVAFAVGLAWLRDRRLLLLAAWCFSFWAFMAVAGLASLPSGRWILNITNIRYWYPIFPPLVMGGFGSAALLLRTTAIPAPLARSMTVGLAALALVPGVVEYRACAAAGAWASDPITVWRDLRSWLGTPEARRYDVIWTDVHTRRYLPAFASTPFGRPLWTGRFDRFAASDIPRAADASRSLILVHEDRFRPRPMPTELRRDWTPVFEGGDGILVVLAHRSATAGESPAEPTWSSLRPDGRGETDTRKCRMRPFALE